MNLGILAQPNKLLSLLKAIMPWAFTLTVILFAIGIYFAFYNSPADYQQGDSVRIMYVHVPASWFALMIYTFLGVCSAAFLIFRLPVAGYLAHAAAPIGAVYAFISLVTGSIWGKPMWGTWWVWDARLTSMLILFIMYLGYIFLADSLENKEKSLQVASVLGVLGLINIPIIKFSVDWWTTLHQPASLLRASGPTIHPSMLVPLLWMTLAYLGLFIALLSLRFQTSLLILKAQTLQAKLAWERHFE